MRFCKYCGTKLEDGQECTCAEAVEAAKEKADAKAEKAAAAEKKLIADFSEVPDEEVAPEKSIPEEKPVEKSEESTEKSVPENKESTEDKEEENQEKAEDNDNSPAVAEAKALPVPANTISDKMLKRGLAIFGALALGLVLFITVLGNLAGNGYKRPVKNVVKGLNRDRAELIISSFYPRDYIEELRDEADDSDEEWEDVTDDLDSLISDVKEVCEDNYFGDDLTVSAKIVKKKPATAKDLRMLKKEFENYDAVVKKAYRIKVRLTVKGDDEKEQVHFYVYSVKLKGGKWLLYPDDKTKGTLAEKSEDIVKDMDKELKEIFSDYSRPLDIVMPE